MDPLEEQTQELEVLESIYPDELEKLSDNQFNISISLDTPSSQKHKLILGVKYPPEYPEVVPELDINIGEYEDGGAALDSDEDEETKETRRNINISETIRFNRSDADKLLAKLKEEADMQVGIPSVFALATQLKDEGEQLFLDKLNTLEKRREDQLKKLEFESSKKFMGTKITRENFIEWRNNLRKELKLDETYEALNKITHNGKLTGKEIFERGLAQEDDIDDLGEQVNQIKV